MGDWNETPEPAMGKAVTSLLTSLEQAGTAYLNGGIDRAEYFEQLKDIDDKLSVAGLRLAVRPWVK